MTSLPIIDNKHGGKPSLTEYSANPTEQDLKHTVAASKVPKAFLNSSGHPDYLRLILTSSVYDVIEATPLTHAVNLSNRLECQVYLKREDLQPVFSFKIRGAYNKMANLDPQERWRGVITCSAGNHAQGVAYSARRLKIPATIVMPIGTPAIKHSNVSRLGGTVILHGEDFDAAKAEAKRLEKLHNLIEVSPFDDPYVIAGQGTIGMEILRQTNLQDLEAVFCCVGGGGLIAGIGVYIKRIAPHVKIIGCETYDADAMYQSLNKGERVLLKDVGLFADGKAVKIVGEETFRVCQEVVDEVITVSTDELCAAIKDVFEDTRSILEPAGAVALAGLKKYVAKHPSANTKRKLVATASGANMNFDRLRFVADRALLGERKEALLSVEMPEKAGSFINLIEAVLPQAVTEFSYRYREATMASIFMGVSVNAPTRDLELADLFKRLANDGMQAADLSNDELAKSHIRFLIGGRSNVENEKLYMFEFPERPGALFKFLKTVRTENNITLFHYRNQGGDVGNILAGIQCPDSEKPKLEAFFAQLGYPFSEYTENSLYQAYLRG